VTVYVCILAPIEPAARPRGGAEGEAAGGKKDKTFAASPPPSRTKWTRRVPHPVLIGHAASLSQASTLWDEYNKGVSRALVVGIAVEVLDPATREVIIKQGLQMKGRIGKSIMRLSAKIIDLGVSAELGEDLRASFVISNHSDLLPLRYAVLPPPGIRILGATMGELDGRKRKAAITSSSGLELLDGKGGEDLTKVDNPAQSGRPDAQPGREADAREDEGRGSSSVTVPPPLSRTKWTRRVPHPVLIGHAASLIPY
jgi:hypothetical protein